MGHKSPAVDWRKELGDAYLEQPPADFEHVDELPSGSSASVSIMRRTSSEGGDELLVVKRIAMPSSKGRGVTLLINEVQMLAVLQHKHIARLRGAYTEPGHLCILLDYCSGGSLETVIANQRERSLRSGSGFDTESVRVWVGQLASAVLFMHTHGVVHRDISTSNVFLNFFANVVIGDLGLAKRVAVCSTDMIDALAVTTCGTPDFLSPELVRGLPYGAASDAWAVGCILFNLLALQRPFQHTSILGLARQIVAVEFRPHAQRALEAANHPPDLKALASAERLLHPHPERRTTLTQVLDVCPLEDEDEDL